VIEIEESIVIARPRHRVFRFAARPENMPLWNPVVLESRTVGTLQEGAQVVQQVELFGCRFEARYQVTSFEQNRRIAYTCTRGPMPVEGIMEFDVERGATRVRWIVGGDVRGLLRLGEGMLVARGRSEMRACLEHLKRLIEEGGARAAQSCIPRARSVAISGAPAKLLARATSALVQRR
jgi:uncharacterized protein YndB with AHSA1/START domain